MSRENPVSLLCNISKLEQKYFQEVQPSQDDMNGVSSFVEWIILQHDVENANEEPKNGEDDFLG